ncbi:MAG: LpqB family beta-propeller domain-containing protein [Gordonia sp. (in: high G+C Gram-positive bacteria)]|uniref:LpqB family beta-propeller domain-containing protein n=1 Tax=Gordonia sp. (in: high G+C Gram-positive bacteria) TaxID=84139 RepID=UPI0039E296B1
MTGRRGAVAAVLAVVGLLLTGCVSIPDSSAPQPIEEFSRSQPANLVPVPRNGDDPETLVRNFVKAQSDPASGHKAARRFMTAGAGKRWDDQGPMTVLRDVQVLVDERSETAVRLRLTGHRTGVLAANGQLTPADGDMVIPLNLTRDAKRWRIDGDLPVGSITDDAQFGASYRSAELFYADRTATHLVGDPRWMFGNTVDPTELVTGLFAGPGSDLSGAVGAMGSDLELRGPVTTDHDQVTVNLGGVSDSDTRNRTVLAAQIVWTLASAGIRGTYLINSDGSPLVPERAEGWTTADVAAFNPDPDSSDSDTLHLVRAGGLFRVGDSGVKPVPGALGAAHDLRSAAVSAGQARVAAVADRDGRQVLLDGPYGGDVREITTGGAITTPTFGASDDTAYTLVDGRPMQWTTEGDAPNLVPLDIAAVTAVDPSPITSIRVSPDGVRVALVVGGKVLLAALATNDRGVPALTGVHPASVGVSDPVRAIGWGGRTTVYLVRDSDDAPVMRISVSGLPASTLVSGNLKAPVSAVSATRAKVYAADSRGVMELGTSASSTDQYWTSVNGAETGTVPVTPSG